MKHFSTIQEQFFYSFPIDVEEKQKIDGIIALLEESGVAELICNNESTSHMGRPEYDPCTLFAVTLLGFSIGKASLRDIESYCKNDLRFIYVTGGKSPSYSTICRFIKDVIQPHHDEIFALITKKIYEKCHVENDTCFIDGTKIEANANKFKFVWKPTKYHESLANKTRNLLSHMKLTKDVPHEGIISSALVSTKVTEAANQSAADVGVAEKAYAKMCEHLMEYLLKTLEYEEKERICGENRNSYFKTDHDATAMCLKQDYYSGLGSSMHAAYQAQIIVSSGLISSYYVSQDRSDLYCFVPSIEIFHCMYGKYPKRIGADSGYGCTLNYSFCKNHGIKAFVKYNEWQGECSGRRPALYEYNESDSTITCLGERTGYRVDVPGRHPKNQGGVFYKVTGCTGCAFMPYCRQFNKEKVAEEKVFEVNPEFQKFKQEARDLLLTPEGIEMRVNRSCQVEGAFGVIKQDMSYTRFRRRNIDPVSTEFMLTCLGYNLRKYMSFLIKEKLPKYWVAPADLKCEQFKKPSAKRLANKVNKKRQKSVNEKAKSSYKYK